MISVKEKLAVTLRYLATGESLNGLKYQFRIHEITIGKFIVPVFKTIFKALAPNYMKILTTKEELEYINAETESRWQFPNCFALVDRKLNCLSKKQWLAILQLQRIFQYCTSCICIL